MNTAPLPTSMELSIPSELGFERVARDAVESFARRLGLASERIEDLKTVVAEACMNAIEHGNQSQPGLRVDLRCVCESDRLMVEIQDHGIRPFASGHSAASIHEKVGGRAAARGMGLLLIGQLADESGFVQSDDPGNRFRFAIRLPGRAG